MASHTGKRPLPTVELSQEDGTLQEKHSLVLQSILEAEGISHQDFFENIWQSQAYYFDYGSKNCPRTATPWGDGVLKFEATTTTSWIEMVHQGWNILSDILETAESETNQDHEFPLVLRNLEVLPREEALASYGTSLFSPYLDGCSIVLNHADLLSPSIAALCDDLQFSFPHAYANSYLTPPNSQTVPAHADDRDVLVFQLVGSKDWQVYQTVPIPYPYPHEQVGKAGIPVPKQVLDGPIALSVRLKPGDVLYLPRGMVHQARSTPDSPSFHVTVALATHDWTLAGNLGRAIQASLDHIVDFRRSILPMTATRNLTSIQNEIDKAFETIRLEVSAEAILKDIEARVDGHNRRALQLRKARINQTRAKANGEDHKHARAIHNENAIDILVGPRAAKLVAYNTIIRAASDVEKAHALNMAAFASDAVPTSAARATVPPRGLNVREEIGDCIMEIISKVKADVKRSYQVVDLRQLMVEPNPLVCDLSLLSLAKRAVELGAFAISRD